MKKSIFRIVQDFFKDEMPDKPKPRLTGVKRKWSALRPEPNIYKAR